jgi:hypothetical protein
MSRLSRLVARARSAVKAARHARKPFRPAVNVLEERAVPSASSSITANFNGTAIPAGDTVWFNSSFTAGGLPKSAPVTLHVVNAAIDFTAGGTPYHVAVPNGVIVLTPGATSATASFDPTDNDWDVSAPSAGTGGVFMGGVALSVPNGLPGGIKNVTWSASFWSDTAGITVNWNWAAAAYKNFSTDYNALGVKPVDNNTLSAYHNGDQSDTPEAFKAAVVAGGTGGGGNNYTGNFTPGKAVNATLGDGVQEYPYPSSNPLTSVAFNESTVLKAATVDTANGYFEVWYSDEHALALGVGQVNVKTAAGTTTTNYAVAPLTSDPGATLNPAVGTTATTGDQAGTDVSGRPMTPSLFITDITNDPTNRSGDWQWGGTAYAPSAVFGTWKSFTRTVDYTTGNPAVSVTGATDPAKNGWNLGPGADAPPAGLTNEGYGAEVRWDLNALYQQGVLLPGHNYRFYVIVHDGDQNKVGGDAGQASYQVNSPIPVPPPSAPPASLSGFVLDTSGGTTVPMAGIRVTLTGTMSTGQSVSFVVVTAADGSYSFGNLAPGTYTVSEDTTQLPSGYTSQAQAGTENPGLTTVDGTSGASSITAITLQAGDDAINYDFLNSMFIPLA